VLVGVVLTLLLPEMPHDRLPEREVVERKDEDEDEDEAGEAGEAGESRGPGDPEPVPA